MYLEEEKKTACCNLHLHSSLQQLQQDPQQILQINLINKNTNYLVVVEGSLRYLSPLLGNRRFSFGSGFSEKIKLFNMAVAI
jgi:hypothetical protein